MKFPLAISLIFLICLPLGCTPQATTTPAEQHTHEDEHGHEHHLESLAAGIEQLKGHRDTIKTAFESGNPHDCDGALHEAVHVLEALPQAEDVQAMASEDQEIIKATAQDVFGLLEKIHDGFHGGGDVETNAYEEIAEDLEKALERLSAKVPASE